MGKFYGKVGYAITVDAGDGVWKESIIERPYYGEATRLNRRLTNGEGINDNIELNMSLSIVADPYAIANFSYIKYVEYMHQKWKVTGVEVRYPRLIFTMGGLYNG